MKKKVQKELKEGILICICFTRGAFGHIYECYSQLLVKQLAFENAGGSELVKEYRIAQFLETTLPSFVAAPFLLMCCVAPSGSNYVEKPSFIQQRIHGRTFEEIILGHFSEVERWSMFLQCNEV